MKNADNSLFAISFPDASGERVIFKVGRASTYSKMIDRWYRFYPDNEAGGGFRKIAGQSIHYFAVRSNDDTDPRWIGAIPVRQCDVVSIKGS